MRKTAKKITTKPAEKEKFPRKSKNRIFLTAPTGQTVIIAVVFIAALLILSLSIVNRGAGVSQENRLVNQKISARSLAEAGIEKALYCLNQSVGTNCGGTFGNSYVGENDIPLNDGTFSTDISSIDNNTKSITSTGYIPGSANPKNSVTIKTQVMIDAEVVNFNYGIQSGIGGLEMHNTSKIIGNVFCNGNIIGANSTEITGDAIVAGAMAASADQTSIAQNENFIFGNISPQLDIAQSFQVSIDSQINKVSFYIKKTGSPSDVTVRILADNDGVPSKIVLGSGTLRSSQVTASYNWVDVNLSVPSPAFTSTVYWVSIDASANSSKYWTLGLDTLNNYTLGKAMFSANWNATTPAWSAANGDLNFKIWLGSDEVTKITDMKIGNDARAHFIEGSDVGRDAYAATIDNDSTIRRDARADTINDSAVIRDAYADNIVNTTVGGTEYPGEAQADALPVGMPISVGQLQEWKDTATGGDEIETVNLSSGTMALGPKKINGNIILSNDATIKITGPVWVTGNIILTNNSKIYIDPAFESQGTVIIASGKINIGNLAELTGTGTTGGYLLVISEYPGTADGDEAITMGNSSATAVIYAPYGAVTIPNSAGLKEVTAYLIKIFNSAIINYDNGLANASFSSGPGGSWILKKGTWQEL